MKMKEQFHNDVYRMLHGHQTNIEANQVICYNGRGEKVKLCVPLFFAPFQLKVNVIWPASRKHLDKFTKSPMHIINETPSLYNVSNTIAILISAHANTETLLF